MKLLELIEQLQQFAKQTPKDSEVCLSFVVGPDSSGRESSSILELKLGTDGSVVIIGDEI